MTYHDFAALMRASTPAAGPGELLWSAEGFEYVLDAGPVVADGTVYVAEIDLHAFDAATGDRQWRYEETACGELHSPTLVDGTLYLADVCNRLLAVDASSGKRVWKRDYEDPVQLEEPAVYGDGRIYAVTSVDRYTDSPDLSLRAVDPDTGEQQWRFTTTADNLETMPPVVADGTVFVHDGTTLYALDSSTGEQVWTSSGAESLDSATVADGRLYVTGLNGIRAFHTATGEEVWMRDVYTVGRVPTVVNGTLYCLNDLVADERNGQLIAMDAATGDKLWTAAATKFITGAPTVAGGTVYVGTRKPAVVAIDAATGERKWQFAPDGTDNWMNMPPTVADGVVYAGGPKETLYALGTDHSESSSGSREQLGTLGHVGDLAEEGSG